MPDPNRPLPVAAALPDDIFDVGNKPQSPAAKSGGRRDEKPPESKQSKKPKDSKESKEPAAKRDPLVTTILEYSPPWLVSMVFHMLLLITMGLIIFARPSQPPVRLEAEAAAPEPVEPPTENADAPGLPGGSPEGEGTVLTANDLPVTVDPLASPGKHAVRPGGHLFTSNVAAPGLSNILVGRTLGSAARQAAEGNGPGIPVVPRGLEWLAKNQQRDGSWSLAGPYSDGVFPEWDNPTAATAMALLAFQGDGNTPVEGKYKRQVAKAWNWLLKQQDNTGCFFQFGNYTHRFYTHGMCSIALCELYAMTKDSRYRAPAQLAIDYCLKTQSPEGGWRYRPNSESDVSVTGWIVMALQSARIGGLNVPEETLAKVGKFLDKAADPHGPGYRYQAMPGESVRLSMTAEALLMREYLGWKRNDPRLVAGINVITSPPNLIDYQHNRNVYYWYYATQAAWHMQGEPWKRWNAVMRDVMPKRQVAHGPEKGSWNPRGGGEEEDDQFAGSGGRLYVTCLSIYMLEVYYRHMPLYSHVYSNALPKPADSGKPVK